MYTKVLKMKGWTWQGGSKRLKKQVSSKRMEKPCLEQHSACAFGPQCAAQYVCGRISHKVIVPARTTIDLFNDRHRTP